MSDYHHTKVLIIGSGPAGYTAGVYASRAMLSPILIQGIEPGGQLTTTTEVENWPGDTEVQGPDLMVRMEAHAKAMGCEIIGDIVTKLELKSRPFIATCDSGSKYTADAIILATGARAKWLGLPSEEKYKGFEVQVFAMVGLQSQAEADLRQFEELCQGWPLVRECHMLNGEVDFMLKCVAPDLSSFQDFLTGQLTPMPNVGSVKTSLVIRAEKDEPGVPFDVLEHRLTKRP